MEIRSSVRELLSVNQLSAPQMRTIRTILLLFALVSTPVMLSAQDAEGGGGKSAGMSKEKQEKHLAKKERKDKKSLAKEEKRLHKKHLENQDKAAR